VNSSDPLQIFRQVMWVSGLACAGLVFLLLLLTAWRSCWRRVLDWEEGFWRRRGIGSWLLTRLRRMEENKLLIVAVVVLLVIHFALLAVSVGAQLYFGPKVKTKPTQSVPLKGHQLHR
jgi:hypothetical protein